MKNTIVAAAITGLLAALLTIAISYFTMHGEYRALDNKVSIIIKANDKMEERNRQMEDTIVVLREK